MEGLLRTKQTTSQRGPCPLFPDYDDHMIDHVAEGGYVDILVIDELVILRIDFL